MSLKKNFKDLQNAWRTVAEDHFKNTRKSDSFEAKYKENEGFYIVLYCLDPLEPLTNKDKTRW